MLVNTMGNGRPGPKKDGTMKDNTITSSFFAQRVWFVVVLALGLLTAVPWLSRSGVLAGSLEDGEPSLHNSETAKHYQQLALLTDIGWAVTEVSGEVLYQKKESISWQPLPKGIVLWPDTRLKTGETGHARLIGGRDEIIVSANTRMELPVTAPDSTVTRILQSLGTIFFKIVKRSNSDFKVETPYLIAVVKGTGFGVSVSDTGTTVSVTDGTVAVTATDSGESVDVSAGQTASVSSAPGAGVSVGSTKQTPGQTTAPGDGGDSSGSGGGN